MTTTPVVSPTSSSPVLLAACVCAVIAGAVVAAVTGPTGWDDGSWVAAFLVLVIGVGQLGLTAGQTMLVADAISRRRLVGQAIAFNGGSGLVVAGTLIAAPVVVTIGAVALLGSLVSFAAVGRGTSTPCRWIRPVYLGLLVVLIASTPVGIGLSWFRQ